MGSTCNSARTSGNLQSKSRRRGSVDGKLLRVRHQGITGFLLKTNQDGQISGVRNDELFIQMLRVIRHPGREKFLLVLGA